MPARFWTCDAGCERNATRAAALAKAEYSRLTRAIALLTVLLVTAAGVACAGAGSEDAPDGLVAFWIELDGEWRLVTANADGSGDLTVLRHVSDLPVGDTQWSPDGTKIAFVDFDGLWVINADGTGLRQEVFADADAFGFAWSPDGGQIALLEYRGLYVADADGTNRRLLVRCDCPSLGDALIAWSPDGRTIAYAEKLSGTHLVHPDGTDRRLLIPGNGSTTPHEFSWSPEGNQIAYTFRPFPYVIGSDGGERENPEKPVMYLINSDGSGERRLGPGEWPVWSPDGTRIAFTRGRILHAINSDGSGERRLGSGEDHPSWSPSGAQIVVRRDFGRPTPTEFGSPSRTGKRSIWVWNVDGSGGRQIWPREGLCECFSPAWQPG